jgi:hypothetical protein
MSPVHVIIAAACNYHLTKCWHKLPVLVRLSHYDNLKHSREPPLPYELRAILFLVTVLWLLYRFGIWYLLLSLQNESYSGEELKCLLGMLFEWMCLHQ